MTKPVIDPWYEERMWKGKCTCGYEKKPRIGYGMICPKCGSPLVSVSPDNPYNPYYRCRKHGLFNIRDPFFKLFSKLDRILAMSRKVLEEGKRKRKRKKVRKRKNHQRKKRRRKGNYARALQNSANC